MPDKIVYHGWRRPPGGKWEKVPGAVSENRLECAQMLSDLVFRKVGEDMETDVFVLPDGQTPGEQQQRPGQSYLHRSMRPWWGGER